MITISIILIIHNYYHSFISDHYLVVQILITFNTYYKYKCIIIIIVMFCVLFLGDQLVKDSLSGRPSPCIQY